MRTLATAGPWGEALERLTERLGEGFVCVACGPRGRGKTQIGAALAVRVLRSHVPDRLDYITPSAAKYVSMPELRLQLQSSYNNEGQSAMTIANELIRPRLLVLDEAQRRSDRSAFESNLLAHVVDARYASAKKDTLVLTNETSTALRDKDAGIDASVLSRALECGGVIDCTGWPNWRADRRQAERGTRNGALTAARQRAQTLDAGAETTTKG